MTTQKIAEAIRQFQAQCEADEYTDTERAHHLLAAASVLLSRAPKVAYILETISTRPDIYGNTYTIAKLTSTRTGAGLWFSAHSAGNARHAVNAHVNRDSVHTVEEHGYPIRQFNQLAKSIERREDQLTAELIEFLDK